MHGTVWKHAIGATAMYVFLVSAVAAIALFRVNIHQDMAFAGDAADTTPIAREMSVFFGYHLVRWDAGWYEKIAVEGYTELSTAFFPLYPMVLRFVSQFVAIPIAASIIGVIGLAVSIFFMMRLAAIYIAEDRRAHALLYFLFFPTAFFLLAPYSEAVFLPILLAACYAIEKKQWGWAILCGGLLGLARVNGFVFSIIPITLLCTEIRNKKEQIYAVLAALAPFVGTAIYALFLRLQFGNAWQFLEAQSGWRRNLDPNVHSIIDRYLLEWNDLLSAGTWSHPKVFVYATDVFFFLAFAGIAVALWRWKKKAYAAFTVLLLLVPFFTGTLSSMPRLVLPAAPFAALMFADQIASPTIRLWLAGLSILGWGTMLMLFVNGYWIA